ncbi:MAG: alpha/beta hydrolase [Devosia sp.]|uniref:alpha/beta fold hydrolase n=1 Tax=Devosia sp. TaxID=1871048 RepID=UPI00263408FD|nr:alpha/beta hydrolase [Devosia sp.]MDB5529894.1 alpha/beta hydrolase [Devosia sp.]
MIDFDQAGGFDRGSIEVSGGSIHYALGGSGPAVVFAHGLGGNMHSWWQQLGAFAGQRTCIVFNHRGFAPSEDTTGVPRPQFYAADLLALLDHLGIAQTAIVAQSMGGWTAMELALLAPDRVTVLVFSGTAGTLRLPGIVSLAETSSSPAVSASIAAGVSAAAGMRMAREQPELYRRYVEIDKLSGAWDRNTVRHALDAMRVRDPGELAAITCPVLAIAGAEDIVSPPANTELLASSLPQSEVLIVPDAGHSAYFERAPLFNEIVMKFLRKSEAVQ